MSEKMWFYKRLFKAKFNGLHKWIVKLQHRSDLILIDWTSIRDNGGVASYLHLILGRILIQRGTLIITRGGRDFSTLVSTAALLSTNFEYLVLDPCQASPCNDCFVTLVGAPGKVIELYGTLKFRLDKAYSLTQDVTSYTPMIGLAHAPLRSTVILETLDQSHIEWRRDLPFLLEDATRYHSSKQDGEKLCLCTILNHLLSTPKDKLRRLYKRLMRENVVPSTHQMFHIALEAFFALPHNVE